jgi:hypothetical protein
MRTRQVGIVLTLALLAWQAAASMPRQAAPVNAGESQATNQDEILHWRSIGEASVILMPPLAGRALDHANYDCAGNALARAGTGIGAGARAGRNGPRRRRNRRGIGARW